jgi:DNA ligase (NAD+)
MEEWTIRSLIDEINRLTELYDKGIPEVSDEYWDNLYFKLKQMEEETGIIYPDSPTQSIHFEKVSELKKVKHNHPMLSLDKTKDFNDIKIFVKNHKWIAMAKMDGLTCSLKYLNGKLVSAETRGNGIEGEDITHNAKVISSIPQKINYKDELIIDGEIICTYEDFKPFKDVYKNPRNFASGSIRLLDSKECKKRHLTFVAWDVISHFNTNELVEKYLSCRLDFINELGFITVPKLSDEYILIDKVVDFFKENCIYPIDGIVFKYDDINEYAAAGRTDHHFKGGLAYKFYDESYETEVKDIEWTMGRTGQLTPVLIYKDIEIDGAICNRASLHNISIMTQLMGGAYPGQKVFIYKANQIIPQVESAQEDNLDNIPMIKIPKICPYCGGPTEIRKDIDSEVLYCTNPQCRGKLINRLDHFCGKKGLDIKGLSKATFEKLIDWGWINNIEDIFTLAAHRNEWIHKNGFGTKSVDKILISIEEHKHTTLNAFISAIGIPFIGKTVAADLTKEFKTYEDFRNAVKDKEYHFYDLPNFGIEMDNFLKTFDYSEVDRISKILIIETPVVNNTLINSNLQGKIIVITGKLTNFKNRDELKSIIEKAGGKVGSSITGKTDLLINNDVNSNSAKNNAAKQRGIPILSEADFIKHYLEN